MSSCSRTSGRGRVEAEALGDLLIGGVPEHRVPTTDQNGHVGDAHVKAIEELLDAWVVVEVDIRMGMAVPREELFDAQGARGVTRAHEHHVAQAVRDQLRPAKDERPHEDVAQLAVGLHEGEELLALELDHLRRLARPDAHEPAPTRQHGGFAGEVAWRMDGHELSPRARGSVDLQAARGDDEEVHVRIAHLGDHFARLEPAHASVEGHAFDLLGREGGENMIHVRGG